MNKLKSIFNRRVRFSILSRIGLYNMMADDKYLKKEYLLWCGKELDLNNPRTFNEKLQWLKLYDRKDIYTSMVDKYEAKLIVAEAIGKEYIIPTIGIYERFDDIDFSKLPNRFVMKCTHDSGGIVICKDKKNLDIKTIRKRFNSLLKNNFYYQHREWPYKNVRPRIIIEKYMEDNKKSMRDYKFFCFNGEPKIMYISEGLEDHKTAKMSFYDMNMNITTCRRKDYKPLDYKPKKPANFDKMKMFSSILSKGIPHLRVDWYEINGKLYFGELTFSTCAGMVPFADEVWNIKLGDYIDLEPLLVDLRKKQDGKTHE